jgi:hypothetical protein
VGEDKMVHPINKFFGEWFTSVDAYLRKSGGGPTYPPKKVTVGPGVLPTGGYSLVEDVGITYDVPPTQYGTVPLPFNPGSMGLPAIAANKNDAGEEIAKENPPPTIISSNFKRLYNGMMNACIADQMHGHNNSNASSACQKLADTGDVSEMILSPYQKEAIGLTPPSEQNVKSDTVQLAENEASLTGQIKTGVGEVTKVWSGLAAGLGAPIKSDPGGDKMPAGDPEGVNFRALGEKIIGFVPEAPNVPGINSGSIIMIGGGILLLILVIAVIK